MICNCKNIKEEVLNNIVINSIKNVISKYANKYHILNNVDNSGNGNENLKRCLLKEKESLELKLNESNNIKFNLYKDKINSVISEKDYNLFFSNVNEDIESYEKRIKSINGTLENIDNDTKNKNNMLNVINKFFNTDRLDRNDILQLIDKIEIGAQCEHHKIKIYFKFNNI